tara:strand:- start:228 stop:713 length:486 start_codon:yes stop_codon:yes gene_type:complete
MAKKGLRAWVKEKWVDIGAPKKDGKYQPCGRKKGSKRKYPKCVPLAKARSMSSSQKRSAVSRKRAAGNPGGKPTNVKTIIKKANGGLSSKNLTVPQRMANAAGMKPVIATKPKGDPTGQKLKGKALTGAIVRKTNGGFIEVTPKGFGRMLKNKRPMTRIYT